MNSSCYHIKTSDSSMGIDILSLWIFPLSNVFRCFEDWTLSCRIGRNLSVFKEFACPFGCPDTSLSCWWLRTKEHSCLLCLDFVLGCIDSRMWADWRMLCCSSFLSSFIVLICAFSIAELILSDSFFSESWDLKGLPTLRPLIRHHQGRIPQVPQVY